MKKFLVVLATFSFAFVAQAQKKTDWKKAVLDKAGDHILVQFGADRWTGVPDSLTDYIKGFSRGLNVAIMLNKPFKSDPRWSVAFGVGISSSNVFFKKLDVDINSTKAKLPFTKLDNAENFKKYKLATAFLEIPLELRYTVRPDKEKSSWKFAIGAKIGTLVNAHTKGKTLLNASGTSINSYTEKENKRTFFNSTRIAGTVRIGIGNYSLFGAYQFTNVFKDGVAPEIKPFQIGICVSGL
jgi:hypothetical protein